MKIPGTAEASVLFGNTSVVSGSASALTSVISTGQETVPVEGKQTKEKSQEETEGVTVEISEKLREMYQEQLESAKEGAKAAAKGFSDMAKLMEIARRISRGDRVPMTDEKKLMEFSSELYQMAKASAAIHANKKHKNHKSLYEEDEEKDEKLRALKREERAGSAEASSQETTASAETAADSGQSEE